MTTVQTSTYKRGAIPLPIQVGMGLWIYGVAAPLIRTLETLGLAERALARAGARRRLRTARTNPFRGYVPGTQDVFVMTYAKSGTNWMMQIAHQLIHHGAGEFDHIHSVVPWPDTQALPGFMRRYAINLPDAIDWKTAPEPKRVIKTHFDWELLPYSSDARYLTVIRDPKDVFVSNYLFIRDTVLGPAMPSVDTWFKLFLSDSFLLGGSWAVNTAGYWAERHRRNVLIVSFKAMKRDLRSHVIKIADFLDIHVPDPVIDEVCRRSSFEYMKGIDAKFRMGKVVAWRPEGAMIRKGVEGGASELLSPTRQREADAYFKSELTRLGSDFPYDEFCDVTP
jgi:hypothetical protein